MGAWSPRPYDNDAGLDFLQDLFESSVTKIKDLLDFPIDDTHYDDYRAAAWFLIKVGKAYECEHLEEFLPKLHDRLQAIKADNDYIDTWKDKDAFIKDLNGFIIQFQQVCKWNNIIVKF